MTELFMTLLNMSISAGWLVLTVLLVRLALKKAPKWVNVLLWGIVAVRLLCPVFLESDWSLIPSVETVSPEILLAQVPAIHSGFPAMNSVVNPMLQTYSGPSPATSVNPLQVYFAVASQLWFLGMVIMAVYTAVSYLLLRRRVSGAVRLRENIYQSEAAPSPFVLGLFRPRIYLPFGLDGDILSHVIAHEQAHIARRDHWWKPLGFLLLSVYWFHPLMWVAYILLCRDIELACDEKVVRPLDPDRRADYSQALRSCSVDRKRISACPLAFGEVGVRERVRSVLSYKKPAFWIIAASLVTCGILAACFLTNPPVIRNPAVQEYVPGAPGILGTVNREYYESVSEDFAIGADKYGRAVFKDPFRAFDRMVQLYPEGLALIQERNDLSRITYRNYELYKKFGWQTTSGSEKAQKQAAFITRFLDIYENSFSKETPQISQEPITKEELSPELIPGTTYVTWQCLYMNPLSSFMALGGDSGCRYTVEKDAFFTENREYGYETRIPVDKWEWQPFPYTDEEWAALYTPAMWGIQEISRLYQEKLYQPLTQDSFLLRMDGELWLVELRGNREMGTYLWSIYSLVPEESMGSAQWTLTTLSSRYPAFRFELDMEYEEVRATCVESGLVDFDGEEQEKGPSLILEQGKAIYWSPFDEEGNLVTEATVRFSVVAPHGQYYSGTLYIASVVIPGENTGIVYRASLVGAGLQLSQNGEGEGGVIRLQSEMPALDWYAQDWACLALGKLPWE